MRSFIGIALTGIVVWGIRRIARRLGGDGLEESLRDHARREMAQGWADAPRWRFQSEIDEMARKCRC